MYQLTETKTKTDSYILILVWRKHDPFRSFIHLCDTHHDGTSRVVSIRSSLETKQAFALVVYQAADRSAECSRRELCRQRGHSESAFQPWPAPFAQDRARCVLGGEHRENALSMSRITIILQICYSGNVQNWVDGFSWVWTLMLAAKIQPLIATKLTFLEPSSWFSIILSF